VHICSLIVNTQLLVMFLILRKMIYRYLKYFNDAYMTEREKYKFYTYYDVIGKIKKNDECFKNNVNVSLL